MEFSLSEEQKLIINTTKKFVESELFPHEELVEKNYRDEEREGL